MNKWTRMAAMVVVAAVALGSATNLLAQFQPPGASGRPGAGESWPSPPEASLRSDGNLVARRRAR